MTGIAANPGATIPVASLPVAEVRWQGATRIIRSVAPPIDLFEDVADPADWPLIISAEQKTNPRLMETIGNLSLVPEARRVAGPGASYLMAPFTQVSTDRPSRFSAGEFGVLYAGDSFEVALFETALHGRWPHLDRARRARIGALVRGRCDPARGRQILLRNEVVEHITQTASQALPPPGCYEANAR